MIQNNLYRTGFRVSCCWLAGVDPIKAESRWWAGSRSCALDALKDPSGQSPHRHRAQHYRGVDPGRPHCGQAAACREILKHKTKHDVGLISSLEFTLQKYDVGLFSRIFRVLWITS
jgi:hypothetical protein